MRDSFNEINITPLTDIFLVLLIIMMVIDYFVPINAYIVESLKDLK